MATVEVMKREEALDETIEESFPASDAPGNTVVTGIRVAPGIDEGLPHVHDNAGASRFEITVDGVVAFLKYERKPKVMVLVHTEVPPPLRGHGLANVLAQTALGAARGEGLSIIALCPFVRAYLRRHPRLGGTDISSTLDG